MIYQTHFINMKYQIQFAHIFKTLVKGFNKHLNSSYNIQVHIEIMFNIMKTKNQGQYILSVQARDWMIITLHVRHTVQEFFKKTDALSEIHSGNNLAINTLLLCIESLAILYRNF